MMVAQCSAPPSRSQVFACRRYMNYLARECGFSLDWSLISLTSQFSSAVRDGRLRSFSVVIKMTLPWSWIFMMPLLLVRPGSAVPISNYVGRFPRDVTTPSSTSSSSSAEIGGIVGGVLAGVVLTCFFFAWYSGYRKRKNESHAEEGGERKERSPGWFSNFKSEFSPDEKAGRFDRFREAFSRREKKAQDGILPVYQTKLPPSFTDSIISRPAPVAPGHVPRYPSILERNQNKTAREPSPPQDLPRSPSITESLRSAPAGDRASRRKVQIPPRALLVPPPGRPLPGLAGRVGVSRSPLSPRSWFSKRLSKHPFIPIRDDLSLQFPPSPLNPDRYQPSRQHLEARLDSRSPKDVLSKHSVRRQPVPLYLEDGGTTKHARIVEALQSSGMRTPLKTPMKTPSRTPTSSKPPVNNGSIYI